MHTPTLKFKTLFFNCLAIFLAISFFSYSQDAQPGSQETTEISKEERVWMTKFFNDFMLDSRAIFTLWGSKPITEVVIDHHSEEEMEAFYNSLSEDEKKQCRVVEDYDLPENWNRWKKVSHRFPIKRYMLFQSNWYNDANATFIYFVDILKTACVIQENYETFRRLVGFDFSPPEVVMEIQDKDSKFWKKARNSSLLWGILFGYGKENAYTFQWKYFERGKKSEKFFSSLHHRLERRRYTRH